MNVRIKENPDFNCDDVLIECRETNTDIEAAAEILRHSKSTVVGSIENVNFIVRLSDILYFESVDKTGFFYTDDKVYQTELRLYEAEEKFRSNHFIRISKSVVVNILKIDEIAPYLASKLRLRLSNGEFIVVSRQYAQSVKRELGI